MHFIRRPGFVELDGKKLFAAILGVRQISKLTWGEVEAASGVSLVSLKRLKRGRSVEATTYLRLVKWLGHTRVDAYTRMIEKDEGGDDGRS